MTGPWKTYLVALVAVWIALLVIVHSIGLENDWPLFAVAFTVELGFTTVALLYLWQVRRQVGEPASWILWLFVFSTLIMLLGLIPGFILAVSRALRLGDLVEYPGLVLASAVLLIGTIPATTAFAIWWRRH